MIRKVINDYKNIFAEIKSRRRINTELEELRRRRAAREELEESY